MKRILSPLILVGAQLLAACGATTQDEQTSPQAGVVQVASQRQALDTCTDSGVTLAQPDGAAIAFQYPNCSYADSAATSIDGSYDQPLCPNKFVTEIQQVYGRPFSAFVEAIPATSSITESACNGVAIVGTAWGYNGTWVTLGSVSTTGIWHPASCSGFLCFPAYCQLRFNIANVSGGYSKVRVAGLAAALGVFKGRVKTGVSAGPGPC